MKLVNCARILCVCHFARGSKGQPEVVIFLQDD